MVTAGNSDYRSGSESPEEGSFSDEMEKNLSSKGDSEVEDSKNKEGRSRSSAQLIQFQFVKSALTVNPCMVSQFILMTVVF